MSEQQINTQYKVNFTDVVKELQIDLTEFQEFLNEKFRVNNRKGKVSQNLTVTINNNVVTLSSTTYDFPKRYVRFLVKKFLARKVEDISAIKVVADNKDKSCYNVHCIVSDEEEQ